MRNSIVTLVLASVASAAFAKEPLIVKTNNSGYVHPDWVRSEKCEIFTDKVVLTRGFGGLDTGRFVATEERVVNITSGIEQVVINAVAETLNEKPNGLCDGPSTRVTARQATGEDAVLFATGGCGSPQQTRDGAYSKMLQDLVDLYCPVTHKFDVE